jgi:protein-tyrosine phosphatase
MIRYLLEQSFPKLFLQSQASVPILPKVSENTLRVDVHSHLLPDLDESSQSLENVIVIIKKLIALGYEKLIITPHIMSGYYPNTPTKIQERLDTFRNVLAERRLYISIEVAAEYYLDDWFRHQIFSNNDLMGFGKRRDRKYLLFETSLVNEPSDLQKILKQIQFRGYHPVMAHPERYVYLQQSYPKLHRLHEAGVLFQVNINSFSNYYSTASRELAEYLAAMSMVSFLGTDCHNIDHALTLEKSYQSSFYKKILSSENLLNNKL